MVLNGKDSCRLIQRLVAGLALLGCATVGRAAGTWSEISLPQKPGEVLLPSALAMDAAGNLYVAEGWPDSRIQKRDAQGNWSVLATEGTGLGQVGAPVALAVDGAENLYVADFGGKGRIQKRDARGNWTEIAAYGHDLGQVDLAYYRGLAADSAGNVYLADSLGGYSNGRIQKRDAQGHWSVIATYGTGLGQVADPDALAVDGRGSLYVADGGGNGRIQKRDTQGNWSIFDAHHSGSLAVDGAGNLYVSPGLGIQRRDAQGNWSVVSTSQWPYRVAALTADTAGNLYIAEAFYDPSVVTPGGAQVEYDGRVRKRDAQGNWSVVASRGTAPGQLNDPKALAVDRRGNLYVGDEYGIEKRDAPGNWSRVADVGAALGQVSYAFALAVDTPGNLYVAGGGIQERDAQGSWTVIATGGWDVGQVAGPSALAVDTSGNLSVAESVCNLYVFFSRLQKRDAQGNWLEIAARGDAVGQVYFPTALATDSESNLYVADSGDDGHGNAGSRIQRRDAQGNWSVIATGGADLGQVSSPRALAVDAEGNLYVADSPDTGDRIQRRDVQGGWSVMTIAGSGIGQVYDLSGLAVDGAGTLYASDARIGRVYRYTPGP